MRVDAASLAVTGARYLPTGLASGLSLWLVAWSSIHAWICLDYPSLRRHVDGREMSPDLEDELSLYMEDVRDLRPDMEDDCEMSPDMEDGRVLKLKT